MKKHLILSLIVASTLLCSCEQMVVPENITKGFLYMFYNNDDYSTAVTIAVGQYRDGYYGYFDSNNDDYRPERKGYVFKGWSFSPNPTELDKIYSRIWDVVTNQQVDSVYGVWEEVPAVKIRFQKAKDYIYATRLAIYDVSTYYSNATQLASHYFGKADGISEYYEIDVKDARGSEQEWYPAYYYTYYGGEWEDFSSYKFEGGEKYTFTLSDNGTYFTYYITKDGRWKAPQRITSGGDTVLVITTQIPIN